MASKMQRQQKQSVPAADTSDPEDLSPEQIDALLARAEQRLKDAHELAMSASEFNLTLPKLRPASLPSPYVQYEKNGIARAEQKSLVDEKERKLAEKTRVVNDPIAEKAKKKEKRTLIFLFTNAALHDDNIPTLFHDCRSRARLESRLRLMISFQVHSYSDSLALRQSHSVRSY
jgi:hypothetical protein